MATGLIKCQSNTLTYYLVVLMLMGVTAAAPIGSRIRPHTMRNRLAPTKMSDLDLCLEVVAIIYIFFSKAFDVVLRNMIIK